MKKTFLLAALFFFCLISFCGRPGVAAFAADTGHGALAIRPDAGHAAFAIRPAEGAEPSGALRAKRYGELLPWDQAKKIVKRKSVFTVIDVETGLRFRAQRRAGSSHLDAQPLTKQDTAIMKRIYAGKWSWRRRAILVREGGHLLAASMHGMPHGGDGIPDNDFAGHFCIHFFGSKTHGSGKVDPAHQLMVRKAAGQLGDYFRKATPGEVVDSFLVALNQQDAGILEMTFASPVHPQLAYFEREMKRIAAIRPIMPVDERDGTARSLETEAAVPVVLHRYGEHESRMTLVFQLCRNSLMEPWRIASISFVARS